MTQHLERLANVLLTVAALTVAAVVVRRELTSAPAANATYDGARISRYVREWKEIASSGVLIGPEAATIRIMEFSDLECPFCKRFHEQTLPVIRERFGNQVALSFIHFPLTNHRFARPAAHAAECASQQGRFEPFVEAIFKNQDSLGLKSWGSYARDAAVPDILSFERCASEAATPSRIDAGLEAARRLGVKSTPTIMVNGWMFSAPPGDSTLTAAITALLAGRSLSTGGT